MGFLLASLLGAMEIHASGTCPSALAIEKRLAPLLGEGDVTELRDVATVVRAGDGSLRVSLTDDKGVSLGERRFPRQPCDEQADAVAVTLAVWEAQIHPEISLRLDRLAAVAPAAPSPSGGAPLAEAPVVSERSAEKTALGAAPLRVSFGVAALLDRQADSWAPSARVEAGLGREGQRWWLRLVGFATAPHERDVAPGRARWWRAAAGAGLAYELLRGARTALELGGAGLLGVVVVEGQGFASNASSRSLDFGGEGWLRGSLRAGRGRVWTGPAVVGWARRQAVDVAGATTSSTLPHLAICWGLGVDFVW